jgi:hypothetical protein
MEIRPNGIWRDYSGRFENRPYYSDAALEAGATAFLREILGGEPPWPITDEDLDFVADMCAFFDRGRDMSELGLDVDAVTIFSSGGTPEIVVSQELRPPNFRLRRRMTIAHELGHVVLHQPLYRGNLLQLSLLGDSQKVPAYCIKAMAIAAVDWVEWQANFFAGALLAPKRLILGVVRDLFGDERCPIDGTSDASRAIVAVADRFDISRDAARVRLAQVGVVRARGDDQFSLSQNW